MIIIIFLYFVKIAKCNDIQASQWEAGTALGALRGLSTQVRAARARGGADGGRRRALAATLRALVERTHDFTDSAYTSHEHRQRILALAERIAYELERLVAVAVSLVRVFQFSLYKRNSLILLLTCRKIHGSPYY